MRRLFRALGVLALLPLLLAADSVTLDKANPNPDAKANVLKGEGTIAFPPDGYVVGVVFVANGPQGNQVTTVRATLSDQDKKWKAELLLPPGKYECWAMMVTLDVSTKKATVHETAKKGVVIK